MRLPMEHAVVLLMHVFDSMCLRCPCLQGSAKLKKDRVLREVGVGSTHVHVHMYVYV